MGAFLRSGASEDFSFINPIETFIDPLAPTESLYNEIISSLCSDLFGTGKPLIVSPFSDVTCFPDLKVDGNDFDYYQDKVNWSINIIQEGISNATLIDQLRNPTGEIYNAKELYEMWRKISLHECLEYFLLSIYNLLKVEYHVGIKTIATFNDLLNNFPTSQIYYIIYKAVGDALRFKVEKGTSAKHASNTVIGHAQSYAERAVAGDWNVPKFGRRDCPQSAVSKFFFERILKIGSDGFYKRPELMD